MKNIEIEKVYLAKSLPEDLHKFQPIRIQVGDFYDSSSVDSLKVRQKGDEYEVIKKEDIGEYKRTEHAIKIKKQEFDSLIKIVVQHHEKLRYYYPLDDQYTCEIDIYQDKLDGYVRLEVEFISEKDMNTFIVPGWFGPEITRLNHSIHKDLGLVTFSDMHKRFKKEGIDLEAIRV